MSVPEPKRALEGHCSAINDGTLYVYSPSGLQSLQLKENATWVEEKAGTSVKGAVCVRAEVEGSPALYVVGGEADDDEDYAGLQRFFFGNKTWETLTPPDLDLQGRTNHSAAYLSDSNSILVYAGSTPNAPSLYSTQTFLISAEEPYNIRSFTSSAAPANQPILLPWSAQEAVMAGGSPDNDVVYTFAPDLGWQQLGTNLSEPLDIGVRASLIQGTDGSKVLETYDMTSSPNKVTQTVLLGADGRTARNGQVLGQQTSSNKRKRDLTLNDWPSYNSSNAPTGSRSDYAVAQDSEGMVVLSGGDSDAPVAMFDQNDNSWVDTEEFFGMRKQQNEQQPLQPSKTSTESTPSATASSEPEETTTEAASGGMSQHDKSMRTLGIVLGTLCGVAALAIIALLYLRWRKSKNARAAAQAGDNEKPTDRGNPNGERLSFVDRGASFMKEAGGSATDLGGAPPRHRFEPNAPGSHSSLAIIGGKFGNRRNTNTHAPKGSFESTTNLVKDRNGGEPVEMQNIGEKNNHLAPPDSKPIPSLNVLSASPDDRRTSGWSKYFSTSQPKELEHMPSAYVKDRESVASQWPSTNATSSEDVSRIPSSVLVPPLDVDFSKTVDGQRLSNVVAHSPSFADSREDLASRGSTLTGQKGQIENGDRPLSDTNTVSSYDRSTMSSEYYNGMSSVNSPWTPFSTGNEDQRPTSSVYTASIYQRPIPSRAARSQGGGFFPGSGTVPRPPKLKTNHGQQDSAEWPSARDAGKDSPLLNSHPPMMSAPIASPIASPAAVHDRGSTATVFPHSAGGNGDRWTANISKDNLNSAGYGVGFGDLAPPRAGFMGAGGASKPADSRDSTLTVFPNDDGTGTWTANQPSPMGGDFGDLAPPRAGFMAGGGASKPADSRDSTLTVFPGDDGTGTGTWTANQPSPMDGGFGDLAPPTQPSPMESDFGDLAPPRAGFMAGGGASKPADSRDSTLTVFPNDDGTGTWTANQPSPMGGDFGSLAPPRAGFMGGGGSKPAENRDSTLTVFPNDDGTGTWTANQPSPMGGSYSNSDLRPPGALGDANAAQDRDSTLTMFPRGVPSAYYANRPKEIDSAEAGKKPMDSDMSWLNLGQQEGGAPRH